MQDTAAAVVDDEEDVVSSEPQNRIQIVVRVRPVLPHEASQQVAVTCSNNCSSVQVVLPEREFSKPAIAASGKPDAKEYRFDACLTGCTSQAELFDICGIADLVNAAVDGYNVTVFAFGQTGSGKTYTIIGPSMAGMQGFDDGCAETPSVSAWPATSAAASGPPQGSSSDMAALSSQNASAAPGAADVAAELPTPPVPAQGLLSQQTGADSGCSSSDAVSELPLPQPQLQQQQPVSAHEGVLGRCVHELFAAVNQRRGFVECSVAVSCTEVYQEAVADLLARNKTQQLQVRQDPRTEAFYVDGLTQVPVQSPGRALHVLSEALAWRHTRAHKLNSYSSRSHCLITLDVVSQQVSTAGQELIQGSRDSTRRRGKLVLVDLAGSERLNSTGNTGARESLKETGAINRSLFTLGQVLAALSVRGGCGANNHVPYRDSKLTQLLWEGLRGGGRVLMLACLCPLKAAAEESLNTLHFASMALRIKSTPVIMMDPQDQQLSEMRVMIKTLQDDCRSLANALTQMSAGAEVATVLQALPPTLVQDALRYGSSSAPALDQQLHHRSPAKGLRSSRTGLRASGSLGKPKAMYMPKPATADPSMRHSMPAFPYHTGSTASSSKSSSSRRHKAAHQSLQQQQQQYHSSWGGNGVPVDMLLSRSLQGSGRNSPSYSWPAYATPPRSTCSMSLAVAKSTAGLPNAAAGASALRGAGSTSLGPSSKAKQFPGSLRQDLYRAGASGLYGVLSGPPQGVAPKPSWISTTRLDPEAARTSQLSEVAGQERHSQACAAAGLGGAAVPDCTTGWQGGSGGIWGCTAPAAGAWAGGMSRKPAMPEHPRLESFPELAALEQQFQLCQTQSPTAGQAARAELPSLSCAQVASRPFDVQLVGSSGVLLPSGLPASINDPRSLIPVRIGVADADCVGTSPNASPAAVALAAADSQMRPIAVALPADLTSAAAAAAEVAAQAAVTESGSQGDHQVSSSGAAAVPDPQALSWAQRNPWFGADTEMTSLAYDVHDMLVGEQGVDPNSPLYYTAIESHVATAFPDKWARWQQVLAAAAPGLSAGGRATIGTGAKSCGSSPPPPAVLGSPVSHKVHLKSPVPTFRSSPGNRPPGPRPQPQQQPGNTPTLSQLLVHPALTAAMNQQQQQQPCSLLLDKTLPQQLLQHYHQEQQQMSQLQLQQHHQQNQQLQRDRQMQQRQVWQQQQASAPQQGSHQQVSSSMVDLPELRQSESPQPPGHGTQQDLTGVAVGADGAAGLGLLAAGSSLGLSSTGIGGSPRRNRLKLHQPQQQQLPAGALAAGSKASIGGISAAASKVLQSSAPSFYDGCGPLTSGMKPAWTSSNQGHGVQAGADLAQVLRSGLNPGNRSLAELQAEYKAARTLVLDRLQQQKEAAEVQRKQILLQLGRAISSSNWRT